MFKIEILDIPDRELGPLIKGLLEILLPKGSHIEETWYEDAIEEAPPKKRQKKSKKGPRRSHQSLLESKLTMTGKLAKQKGSAVARGLLLFENCEVEDGIGNVSVQGFRDYLKTHRMQKPELLQKRMLRDGYIDYLK